MAHICHLIQDVCSCVNCCIENYDISESCSCENCTEPNICLYYDKRKSEPPMYELMIQTLSRQGSAVDEQEVAYLLRKKRYYCTVGSKTGANAVGPKTGISVNKPILPAKNICTKSSDVYGLMIDTLSRQVSAVEDQKSAYLPQSSNSCCTASTKPNTPSSDKKYQSSDKVKPILPTGIYGDMIQTLSRQESAVKDQRSAYLPQSKRSLCTAGSKLRSQGTDKKCVPSDKRKPTLPTGIYGDMIETLSRQESAVEEQKGAYFPQSKRSFSTAGSKPESLVTDKKNKQSDKRPAITQSKIFEDIIETLSRQESAVNKQKSANVSQSNNSCCTASLNAKSLGSDKKCLPADRHKPTLLTGIYGDMIETLSRQESAIEDQKSAYLPQSKRSFCTGVSKPKSPGTDRNYKPSDQHKATTQSEIYADMINTLSRQESAVEDQKSAYLPQSKSSCYTAGSKPKLRESDNKNEVSDKPTVPTQSGIYADMIKTLTRQESAVEDQKSAYLPQSKSSCYTAGSKPKLLGPDQKTKLSDKRIATKQSGVYAGMIETLLRQESAVEEQKTVYLPQSKSSCCSTGSKPISPRLEKKNYKASTLTGIYANMIETLSQQESIIEKQKSAYLSKDNNCCGLVVKTSRSDKHNASSPCSSEVCMLEQLKSVIEFKNICSIQDKCCNCKSNNNIPLYKKTPTDVTSGKCKGRTGSRTSPCTCSSKNKRGPKNKLVFNVNRFDTKPITSETELMSYNKCSVCSELAIRKYESPKFATLSKENEPTKHMQELLRNIIPTPVYKNQNKNDKCDTYTDKIVSESPGYVFELPKHTHNLTLQPDDCQSNRSSTINSNLSLTTMNTREAVNKTREFNINRCAATCIAFDAKNSLVLKKQPYCHDDDSVPNMFESCGYMVELPKDKEKRKCYCKAAAKHSSDKPGCDFKREFKIVNNLLNKNSGSTELVARALPKCLTENPISHKNGCVCRKLDKFKFVSPVNAQKQPCGCAGQQKSEWPKSEKQSCVFEDYARKMKSMEVPGYVFEIPKHTRNSCNCNKSRKKSITSDTQSICKNIVGSTIETAKDIEILKSPIITSKSGVDLHNNTTQLDTINVCVPRTKDTFSFSPNIYTVLCNNILKKQTEAIEGLKKIYLPCKSNNSCTMNFQLNILKKQAESIEVLKNIYLPHKHFELLTKTCCTPISNLTNPSDDGTEILIAEDFNESTACTSTTRSKCSSEHNILEKQAQSLSVERLKKNNEVKFELPTDSSCDALPNSSKSYSEEFGGSFELNLANVTKIISKCDLFNRLKEIYKACSCRICECKPNKTKAHKCQTSYQYVSPRLSYETNRRKTCGCKPCNCTHCTKIMNIHRCQTIVVAPIGGEEHVSRLESNCSPCSSFKCGIVCPLDSHVVNEMSTSRNRHALCRCEVCLSESRDRNDYDSCTCLQNTKVMSKPVEPDTHDFELRTTKMIYNKPIFRQMSNEKREYHKAINDWHEYRVAQDALDTAENTLPTHDQNSKSTKATSNSDLVYNTKKIEESDYIRINNTLKRSKEFNEELIRLLNTYEKANREFESITKTLKISQECS